MASASRSVAIPPHDLNIERAVLGVALLDGPLAAQVAQLPPSLFFLDRHRQVLSVLPRVLTEQPGEASLHLWRHHSGIRDVAFWAQLFEDGYLVLRLEPHVKALTRLANEREVLAYRAEPRR
jgi:hypothetical protein